MKKMPLILFVLFFVVTTLQSKQINIYEGEDYLAFADVMPEPDGGLPAIYKLISYPAIAKKAGIQGKVYLMAFISETGNVDDVKVIKGIGGGCDEAAIEAVKQTKFSSAQSGGKNVKVKMSLQIQFKLD